MLHCVTQTSPPFHNNKRCESLRLKRVLRATRVQPCPVMRVQSLRLKRVLRATRVHP